MPAALLALGFFASPLPAHAGVLANSAILPLAAQMLASAHCQPVNSVGVGGGGLQIAAAAALPQSKSAAILGGAPSRLEQMRSQQSSLSTSLADAPGFSARGVVSSTDFKPLQPALGGGREIFNCSQQQSLGGSMQPAYLADARKGDRQADNFLASKRVTVGRTMFDNDWNRVRYAKVSSGQLAKAVGSLGHGNTIEIIAKVNRWTNKNIRYVEDKDLWGKADLWAGAATTLKLRKGDCEDIAITKMQLLAAAGISRNDMILTIARDLVRNADHALLIVRNNGKYYMLDNSTDQVLDAQYGSDYRPVLSFSEGKTWLHGY
jgi:predicted transglutaminase-like cysteine proteinase